MIMRLVVFVLCLGLVPELAAQSPQTGTVSQFLESVSAIAESKCRNRGELERQFTNQGKNAEARSARIGEAMICDCMPARVKALRSSLPQRTLDQPMADSQFQEQYGPEIVNKCAADQLRANYGEGCGEAFASRLKNSGAYCQCMQKSLSKLSDNEAAKIGAESSAYFPQAASAKQKGKPLPEQPPSLKRFTEIDKGCRDP